MVFYSSTITKMHGPINIRYNFCMYNINRPLSYIRGGETLLLGTPEDLI